MIGDGFPEVLRAAQQGDEAAFTRLFRDTQPVLLRYLRVLAPGAHEDAAAETWVSAVRGLAAFRGDESAFRGWLLTLARRRAVDQGRARQRRPETAVPELPEPDTAPDTADLALEALDTERALALVATLPPLQAEVVALRVIAGLDVAEVARIVGRRPGAVRVAAHRGLARLAEVLAQQGVTR